MAGSTVVKVLPWKGSVLVKNAERAFVYAVKDVQNEARRRNPAPSQIKIVVPKIDTRSGSATIMGRGRLAHIFEMGRKGGYIIQPGITARQAGKYHNKGYVVKATGKVALKFTRGDNNFYRGAGFQGGAQREEPYMRPSAGTFVDHQRRRLGAEIGKGL